VASESEENKFTEGISNFAVDFYQQCSQYETGDLLLSPFSVAMTLLLLSQATNGEDSIPRMDKRFAFNQ